MSVEAHIKSLRAKHDQLEEQLHDDYIHHERDEVILELKRQKLQIKDEILALTKEAA